MKIRSITCFCDPQFPIEHEVLHQLGNFKTAARLAFEGVGYEVQTTRLAIIPFPKLVPDSKPELVSQLALDLETAAQIYGFDYVAIGPALLSSPWSYEVIPQVMSTTQRIFASGMMTDEANGISLAAVQASGRVIYALSRLPGNGFANLRFGALANVKPGGPFFPGAYHAGGPPVFAIATEAADLAVEAFQNAHQLEEARRKLIESVERHTQVLGETARNLAKNYQVIFGGFDFTLAPFPEPSNSFGRAMELLGAPAVGLHGSLAAAAVLTDTLDQAIYPRAGFNGLMLPVLEDSVLAARAAEGSLTLKDLLLYASVCGTGLDTLPLPGDTSADQLAAILLDVAALSQRLKKPLIARLMPIPGKVAGDPVAFDFPYFANSRVLSIQAQPLQGLLAGDETIFIKTRDDKADHNQ